MTIRRIIDAIERFIIFIKVRVFSYRSIDKYPVYHDSDTPEL